MTSRRSVGRGCVTGGSVNTLPVHHCHRFLPENAGALSRPVVRTCPLCIRANGHRQVFHFPTNDLVVYCDYDRICVYLLVPFGEGYDSTGGIDTTLYVRMLRIDLAVRVFTAGFLRMHCWGWTDTTE